MIPTEPPQSVTVPLPGTTTTGISSLPYVPANSLRGRTILLLRNNKLVIAAELLLFLGFLFAAPFLGFVDFICVYLIVAGLIWLRGGSWRDLGLNFPVKWRSTLFFGVSFCLIYLLLDTFAISPLLNQLFHQQANVRAFAPIHGNVLFLLGSLIVAWTHAGFGEEMIYRGYLLNRAADLFGRNPLGWAIALLVESIGFSLGHIYQGISGIVGAGIYGLLIGLFYLAIRRNLWACVVAHALNDTISFLFTFL